MNKLPYRTDVCIRMTVSWRGGAFGLFIPETIRSTRVCRVCTLNAQAVSGTKLLRWVDQHQCRDVNSRMDYRYLYIKTLSMCNYELALLGATCVNHRGLHVSPALYGRHLLMVWTHETNPTVRNTEDMPITLYGCHRWFLCECLDHPMGCHLVPICARVRYSLAKTRILISIF